MVCKAQYEVHHMTRVLHTARISNVLYISQWKFLTGGGFVYLLCGMSRNAADDALNSHRDWCENLRS